MRYHPKHALDEIAHIVCEAKQREVEELKAKMERQWMDGRKFVEAHLSGELNIPHDLYDLLESLGP